MSKTTTKTTQAKSTTKAAKATRAKTPAKGTPLAAPKRKTKAEAAPKRLSALDAAAQVLARAKEPLGAKALIEAMAQQNLWTSPGGKTPHATLYAAMIREIATKGAEARFQKVDRGQFTLAGSEGTKTPAKAKPAPKATGKGAGKKQPADGTPGPKSVSELFQV